MLFVFFSTTPNHQLNCLFVTHCIMEDNVFQTGQALAVSVEVLRHANIVTGGAGVLNSLLHIVLKVPVVFYLIEYKLSVYM